MTTDRRTEISSPPDSGTSALLEYFWTSICDRRLFSFVIDVVLRGDFVAYVAKQALDGKEDYKNISPAELAQSSPGSATRSLRQSSQELLEVFLSRAVDNFEVYLVDVIRLALHKQPRILSDRKQELTLGHILKFDSIEALSRDIIEGKLNALSYEGFGKLEAWCQGRSIPLVVPDGQRTNIVELIALRNIIVHSRGVVDERYRSAVPASAFKVGDKRELDIDDLFRAIGLLDSVVTFTDNAVAGKFGLHQLKTDEELKNRSEQRWPRPDEGSDKEPPKDTMAAIESAAVPPSDTKH